MFIGIVNQAKPSGWEGLDGAGSMLDGVLSK
jgi:hypothetical protein